jgi:hypothetical protein
MTNAAAIVPMEEKDYLSACLRKIKKRRMRRFFYLPQTRL